MWGMIALSAVQAGTQIYSGYKQKEAAYENAKLMEEQAQFQQRKAYEQSSTVAKQGQSYIGSQRASIASSGVKLDTGSSLAALRESERNVQSDVSRTMQAGDLALRSGYNQANQLRKQGNDAFTSSLIGGATSFAGTVAGNVGMKGATPTETPLSGIQKTAINNSDINYTDFGRTKLPSFNQPSNLDMLSGKYNSTLPPAPNYAKKKKSALDMLGLGSYNGQF